jgi:outer membrane murein-binding lipoprotein Lpp
MKKLFTFFAVATFVVALSSCGGAKTEEAATDATEVSTETAAPADDMTGTETAGSETAGSETAETATGN